MIAHIPILIPISLIFSAFFTGILGVMRLQYSKMVAGLASAVAFLMSVWATVHVLNEGSLSYNFGSWPPPIGIEFVLDYLSAFMLLVITGTGFILLQFPALHMPPALQCCRRASV